MAKKQKPRYKTFRLQDRTGTIQHPILVVGESFEAYRVVYQDRHCFENRVVDGTILKAHVEDDHEASIKKNSIYYKQASAPELLTAITTSLRDIAVKEGATPEAIRLLDELQPWSDKEKKSMAEKLKSKASAAKPDKAGLKSAAKSAPVGGKKSGGKRGNAEALAKARAARQSGPDNRKITPLIKPKEIEARDGTFRRRMLEDLLSSKTVQQFRDKDKAYDAGCLRYAVNAGIVKLAA